MNNTDSLQGNGFWRSPIFWGVVVTASIIGVTVLLAFHPYCEGGICKPAYEKFLNSPPNEMGDTLAGVAGMLAFLWIIVTVWLQSQELAAQRAELRLTREETKRTADALGEQVEVLLDEQKQRGEDRAERLLEQLLDNILVLAEQEKELGRGWVKGPERNNPSTQTLLLLVFSSGKSVDRSIIEMCKNSRSRADRIMDLAAKQVLERKSNGREFYIEVASLLEEVGQIEDALGEHQLARIRKLRIGDLRLAINGLLGADVWDVSETKEPQ